MEILRKALRECFHEFKPTVTTNWELSGRAVSETGGRLIEDFVLLRLPQELDNADFEGKIVCNTPASGRTIEDIEVKFTLKEETVHLLVDVKGHNQHQEGSRPNLASVRKCIKLYSDESKCNHEIVIFFCRYEPSIKKGERSDTVSFEVLASSFSDTGLFRLSALDDKNMDPADIGSGGQILLAREHDIGVTNRSRSDFVKKLQDFEKRLAKARANKAKKKAQPKTPGATIRPRRRSRNP